MSELNDEVDPTPNNNSLNDNFEPFEYFKKLKASLNSTQQDFLDTQLAVISNQIVAAKKMGQDNVVHKLAWLYRTILKEQMLFSLGYRDYVHKEDVVKWLKSIVPVDSVKIIEFKRFPRLIPEDVGQKIQKMRELEIFDEIYIIYTDFTNEGDNKTLEEKNVIERNRDPIAVGTFEFPEINFTHNRMYFIADWVDEYCDLTFSGMLDKMAESGIANPKKMISSDQAYLNRLINDALLEVKKTGATGNRIVSSPVEEEVPTVIKKIFKFFKKFKKERNILRAEEHFRD